MNKLTVREMILAAMFACLMIVGAKLSLPTPFNVRITLQLFIVFYAGLLLGAKVALLSQIVYLALGIAGLPVFAGESAGFEYIVKPTFGYLIGFVFAAYVIGFLSQQIKRYDFVSLFKCVFLGYLIAYIFGIGYHYFANNIILGQYLPLKVILGFMFAYMIKDFILMIVAIITALRIIPTLYRTGFIKKSDKFCEKC